MKKTIALFISVIMLVCAFSIPVCAQAASVGKVTSLSVASKGSTYIKLKWKKVSKATGYQVYCSTYKSKNYKKVKTIKKGSTVTAKITGLKSSKTYYFKVRAVKNSKKGKFSKVVSAKTKAKSKNIESVVGSSTWSYDCGRGELTFTFDTINDIAYYKITGKLGEEDSYSYYLIENNKICFQLYNESHCATETYEVSPGENSNQIKVKRICLYDSDGSVASINYTLYKI